jgi:secreted Zn-dependent insulinase-like peptidase
MYLSSKSTLDKKLYFISTLQNGLEVLLISTNGSKIDKAAAALSVQTGSFADPDCLGK